MSTVVMTVGGCVMDSIVGAAGETVSVVHLPGRSRFEAHARGRRVATLDYRISGPAAVLTDTRPVGGGERAVLATLVDAALEVLIRSGYYAVALCPHVRDFLRAHPERRDGVDLRFLDPVDLLGPVGLEPRAS